MIRRKRRETGRMLWDENPERVRLENSKQRAVVIRTVIAFCFFVICLRLVDLMVLDHHALSKKAEMQYLRVKTLKSQRGVIWDRNTKQMAVNIEVDSLYAVPSSINDTEGLSSHLAPIIKVSAKRLSEKFLAKKNKDFIWLTRKMNRETSLRVREMKNRLKLNELGFITEMRRYYPKGQIASNILGYTNIDNDGIDGIELIYDDYLKGKIKKVRMGRDARGNSLSGGIVDDVYGNNLILTIDENIQHIVERYIEKAMRTWKAEAVVAIMMDPFTGEILAMANRPSFDPNFSGRAEADKRRNRTVTDIYEPGSTFKVILASAALEEDLVELDEEFDVSDGFIKVPGGIIRDVHKNEILTFKEVIQKSSNVGSIQVGLRLGEEKFYSYIKKFGFGEKTGIDLPGEARGILRGTEKWSGRSLASISIGQEIGVTPLQLLRAYAVVANGGKLVKPYIVSEIISPSGEIIKKFSPEVEREVISEDTAAQMREVLKTVIEQGGTAQRASIKGNLVAGKTGTAQIVDPETGQYSDSEFIGSFVGFVPADNPRLALVVVVYKPQGAKYGGVVAAPVFRDIVQHTLVYLDYPMEREDNNILLVKTSR